MQWILKKYKVLTLDEFHDILQLRTDVFVVEQNCPYPEIDGKDKIAFHFFAKDSTNTMVAYTRIFKAGDYYKEAAFGRVVVHTNFRNQKLGYLLVKKTIDSMIQLFGKTPIKIGAQTHLRNFYGSFGFTQVGEAYIEDGIPHIYMVK